MDTDPGQSAHVGDNGASVNINLGGGFKQFWVLLIGLFLSLAINLGLSCYGIARASDAEWHAKQWEYWGSRLESNLLAHGFEVPPSPLRQQRSK